MGGEGGEDGNSGGCHIGIGELKVGADPEADSVPEIGGETGGADEIEGEFFGDGGCG